MVAEGKRVEDYLTHLTRCGRREKTVGQYRATLKIIADRLGLSELDPERIGTDEVMRLRMMPDLCETTRVNYARCLNLYMEWATGRNLLRESDVLWNRPVAVNRKWITDDDLMAMWSHADARERVILALGAFLGARRTEIKDVRWCDIKPGNRIILYGKGHGPDGKSGEPVRMPPRLIEALEEWRTVQNPEGLPDKSDGRIVTYIRCGEVRGYQQSETISHLIQDLARRSGVEASTHSLRRLFATDLDERGIPVTKIARLMRHSDIQTTYSCYIDPNPRMLDEIMDGVGMF